MASIDESGASVSPATRSPYELQAMAGFERQSEMA